MIEFISENIKALFRNFLATNLIRLIEIRLIRLSVSSSVCFGSLCLVRDLFISSNLSNLRTWHWQPVIALLISAGSTVMFLTHSMCWLLVSSFFPDQPSLSFIIFIDLSTSPQFFVSFYWVFFFCSWLNIISFPVFFRLNLLFSTFLNIEKPR